MFRTIILIEILMYESMLSIITNSKTFEKFSKRLY